MVNVLVILDGASEAPSAMPSSLDLADALLTDGGVIRGCPDHGCDPATGLHVAGPVPCVTWSPATVRA